MGPRIYDKNKEAVDFQTHFAPGGIEMEHWLEMAWYNFFSILTNSLISVNGIP